MFASKWCAFTFHKFALHLHCTFTLQLAEEIPNLKSEPHTPCKSDSARLSNNESECRSQDSQLECRAHDNQSDSTSHGGQSENGEPENGVDFESLMEETDEDDVNVMETNEEEPLDHFKVFFGNSYTCTTK